MCINSIVTPQDVIDGTSASAPVFAAMVAHINARLALAGKPPLGFLNPALYGLNGTAFHDITVGDNACGAGSPPTCCPYGFLAFAGKLAHSCRLFARFDNIFQWIL
jgi:subtilase family serine protease